MIIGMRIVVSNFINFNFCVLYEVEIRFSDNLEQKETIYGIIRLRRKKRVIFTLDIIFSITHMAQLVVSEINFCQRDI